MPTVKMPDGSTAQFPDGMSQDDIQKEIETHMAGQKPPSTLEKIGTGALDLAKGAGEGMLHTISSADDWASKHLPAVMTTPIGQSATPENSARATAYAKELQTPADTTQKIGKIGEQAGEFLIPGGGEEKIAATGRNLLSKIPMLEKAAPTIAKVGSSALGGGVMNKLQGGSFEGGAGAGAAGAAVGAGLKAIAPVVAETALKVRGADRAYGATPGKAILDSTEGFTPRAVVDSARDSLQGLHADQANLLSEAPGTVSLVPTRAIGDDFFDRALSENHPGTVKDLHKLNSQVAFRVNEAGAFDPNAPIPDEVTPLQASALNRGLANAKTSWNPATATDTMNAAAGQMHHQLAEGIRDVVPEIGPVNQQVQSLMPVVQRGTAADLNAGVLQRISTRIGAPTGALAGGLAGFHFGGIPGAVAGVALPEILSSPTTQMAAARAMNSPAIEKLVMPAAEGAGMQATREPDDYDEDLEMPPLKLPARK